MALSPSHKFGQIIGEILEKAMTKYLKKIADQHGLYLDTIGKRPARSGKKVTWQDDFGNKHDLDFVLERNGTDEKIGTPVAFIESAWRRYTKHSRNKAQEIQGAILPLAETHKHSAPFLGVILAGVFTEGALSQLRSRGFKILYFEYSTVIQSFNDFGLDASFDENTSSEDFLDKIKQWEKFKDKEEVIDQLVVINQDKLDVFFEYLKNSIERYISEIRVLPLYGNSISLKSVKEAINYLRDMDYAKAKDSEFVRFEVNVIYSNGDSINANFSNASNALDFLSGYDKPKFDIIE